MGQVKFDYSKTAGYVHEHEVESMKALKIGRAHV